MNKSLTKIIGATLGIAMALGVGFAIGNNKTTKVVAAPGDEVNLSTESFDSGDYTSRTAYQGTVTEGPENGTWTIYYGCFSTSSVITGTRSAAIRLYTTNNYGYLKSNFPFGYVTKITFKIKAATSNSAAIKVNVEYSTNDSDWSFMKQTSAQGSDYHAIQPSSSATLVTLYMPTAVSGNQENVYLKWSIDSTSTKPSSGNAQLTIDDITVYYIEQEVAGTYSVTFNSNGGSSVPNQNVGNSGSETATEPNPAPTKVGFDFAGWYDNEGLNGDAYDFNTPVTDDLVLYAKWTKKNFTSPYSPSLLTNGNDYRISGEVTVKSGGSIFIQDNTSAMQIYNSALANAVSVGNTVDVAGVYQSGNNAEITNLAYYEITSDDTTNSQAPLTDLDEAIEANRFRYFEFSPVQLTSAFNNNKKASLNDSDAVLYYSNTSYVNGGAFNPESFAANDFVSIKGIVNKYNSEMQLQIAFIEKLAQYTVTFHSNGGSDVTPQSVLSGGNAEEPVEPTKNPDDYHFYEFAGWYDNEGLTGSAYNFATAVNSNIDLYAKWNVTDRFARDIVGTLRSNSSLSYNYTREGATDMLDRAFTTISGTDYGNWSTNSRLSSASFAGNSAGGNDSIQLRKSSGTQAKSGIVSTTSGGKVTKVVVAWNSNTAADRTLNVYGKNTAYSSVNDLYGDAEAQGTLLGTIVKGTSTELTVSGDYTYVGLVSNAGAMYFDSINIEWDGGASFDFTNLAIRFGAVINADLFDRLETESNVLHYGVMFTKDSDMIPPTLQAAFDTAPECVSGSAVPNAETIKFISSGDTPTKVGENYIWNYYKRVPNNELTKYYNAIAFIETANNGVIYLNGAHSSIKSLANEMINNDPLYDYASFGGSLYYLANLVA